MNLLRVTDIKAAVRLLDRMRGTAAR